MTAQPDHPVGGRIPAIPLTINAIGDSLSGEERAQFYREVLAAEAAAVPAVMRLWWKTAMLNRAPGAIRGRADATTGRGLVSVDALIARVEGAER
ncbi:hypothetical protein [Streptomyces sp. NPDC059802]|uniref:hypothetical protein n=1 Tax=Streptomyces sp. NPDC059802 TaxID=3346952 RepID=UPI00364BDC7A